MSAGGNGLFTLSQRSIVLVQERAASILLRISEIFGSSGYAESP